MKRLTEIANKYGTDKGTEHYEKHGYTEIYEDYIDSDKKLTLLEIGVWKCESLRMWNEYNPNINLHGIDINKNVFNYLKEGDKFTLHIGSQSDEKFINETIKNIGKIDVVIDDGSHSTNDIIKSFTFIYPNLKKGSLYFIEDLHASQANFKQIFEYINSFKNKDILVFNNNKLILVTK